MASSTLETLRHQLMPIRPIRSLGRIKRVEGLRLTVTGLDQEARLNDELICRGDHGTIRAEVVALHEHGLDAMPFHSTEGLSLGQAVELAGPACIAPSDSWLGRIVDPFGVPLDSGTIRHGTPRPIRAQPPSAGRRNGFGKRLPTGYVALDTLLPMADGQRMGVFAGSGVGKSMLLANLAEDMDADIAVIVLVGERGREVASFARDVLGGDRMRRAVIVAATSDRPANVRRRALPAALTVAEHFRDKGARVLFLCDSLTRHAEAYRDVAGDTGNGLPPGLVSDMAACLERAGPGTGGQRAITAIFSVLVAGADMEEPIADAVRGLLDGHIVLSRAIAEAGRYPAIDFLASTSRSLPGVASPEENKLINRTKEILEVFARNELMISSGLYERGADPRIDEAIGLRLGIEAALTSRSDTIEDSFAQLEQALGRGRIGR